MPIGRSRTNNSGEERQADLGDVDVDSVLSNLHRLQAVSATGLVNKPPRADLDSLTEEASQRFGGLKAQVTLVDDHRQVFINTFGETGPNKGLGEEPLSYSYCKYVVAYNDVLVVQDATTDPVVKDNPATLEKGLRSYLGVPIHSQGEVIGSFCVFDEKPREWSADDLNDLFQMAGIVEEHIENQLEEDQRDDG